MKINIYALSESCNLWWSRTLLHDNLVFLETLSDHYGNVFYNSATHWIDRVQDVPVCIYEIVFREQHWLLVASPVFGVSARTVRNRLREHNIRPRRPALRTIFPQRHRSARLHGVGDIWGIDSKTGLGFVHWWIKISFGQQWSPLKGLPPGWGALIGCVCSEIWRR